MDRHTFTHLCQLARLELTDHEVGEFEAKFQRLLGFVDKLLEYAPESTGTPMTLADKVELRRDNVEPFDWPEDMVHDYRVPQVIDFEGDS